MTEHAPVLLEEAIAALAIKENGLYIDATFGRGGHSAAILEKLGKDGRLIAIDKDLTAVKCAKEKFAKDTRFSIVHSSFAELQTIVTNTSVRGKVNGILLDLGVSSPQLDDGERGFSFLQDGPLDMRMNQEQELDAKTWINHAAEKEIADVIFQYGEDRYSRRLARAIVTAREEQEITRTAQLAQIIKEAHPKWEKHKHPATRAFQAIRIFINRELEEIKEVLEKSVDSLEEGGRLAVISFHSLEDRIVKQFMQLNEKGPTLPRHLPLERDQSMIRLRRIGKAIKASEKELEKNIRSRSAVLRVAEKI